MYTVKRLPIWTLVVKFILEAVLEAIGEAAAAMAVAVAEIVVAQAMHTVAPWSVTTIASNKQRVDQEYK